MRRYVRQVLVTLTPNFSCPIKYKAKIPIKNKKKTPQIGRKNGEKLKRTQEVTPSIWRMRQRWRSIMVAMREEAKKASKPPLGTFFHLIFSGVSSNFVFITVFATHFFFCGVSGVNDSELKYAVYHFSTSGAAVAVATSCTHPLGLQMSSLCLLSSSFYWFCFFSDWWWLDLLKIWSTFYSKRYNFVTWVAIKIRLWTI